jgi:predicted transcriptional regulator of viral defense system
MLIDCQHIGGSMINQLAVVEHQPFDYQYLKGLLQEYKYPRNKISNMLKSGDIISLKSGLYVLSELYRKPLVMEHAANMLYGPSYVSLDYALSYYGLIPEHAYQITSVTSSRKKEYQTALGTFLYRKVKAAYYSIGYTIKEKDDIRYLIATPEKAICDKLYLAPLQKSADDLAKYLELDLRLDSSQLRSLNKQTLQDLAKAAASKNLNYLLQMVG